MKPTSNDGAAPQGSRPTAGSGSTQSVQRALQLLTVYAERGPDLAVADFVTATSLNKSTVHRLLNDLVLAGFLERDPDTSRYRIGSRGRGLATVAAREQDLVQIARRVILETARRSTETVDLDVLEGPHNVVIVQAPGLRSIQIQGQIGQRRPAHCTSTGKVLLAHLPLDEVRQLLPERLEPLTSRTIVERSVLESELEQIREQGYAVNMEEVEIGMVAVGAPVFDAGGTVVAALSIGGPIYRLKPESLGAFVKMAREAAREISQRLGHSPQPVAER